MLRADANILSDIRFADARRWHAVNLGVGLARLDQARIRHVLLTVDHVRGKPGLRFGCRGPVYRIMDVNLSRSESRESVDEVVGGRWTCLRVGLFGIKDGWDNDIAARAFFLLSQLRCPTKQFERL